MGIHISRGVRMRIPPGGLVLDLRAGMRIETVELQLDTCIHWLEIALEHLASAVAANQELVAARPGNAELGAVLDREFKASVQAAVAAATFFEALHAATMDRCPPPVLRPSVAPKKRPTRYATVAEQLRRSFGLRKQGTANLRSVLVEVYRFRDQAVHPTAAFTAPVLHPQLNVGVEHRFVMFCASSAQQLVRAALAFSKILPSRDLSKRPKEIQEFGAYLLNVCEPLYIKWEQLYGPLLDAPSAVT
jgi:hypothetical protein